MCVCVCVSVSVRVCVCVWVSVCVYVCLLCECKGEYVSLSLYMYVCEYVGSNELAMALLFNLTYHQIHFLDFHNAFLSFFPMDYYNYCY